jgi:hypothetical protein
MANTNLLDHANFLLTLREAAKEQPNLDLRYGLRSAADGIQAAIHDMCAGNVTVANMVDLNGLWTYATRLLTLHKAPPTPSGPQSDAADVAPLRKAA